MGSQKPRSSDRFTREALALRENLKKRKEQARARAKAARATPAAADSRIPAKSA